MIIGVGIDLIEVERIRRSLEKFGERFLKRILRENEIAYCQGHRFPAPFVAARFAAKEAISKAFGTGIGHELGWLDVEVAHEPAGRPYFILQAPAQSLLNQKGGKRVHLSISHTENHATAVAIIEG
jgi:holo-[acyl-carrier protein] synthase